MLPDLSTETAFKANFIADGPLAVRCQEGRRWEFKKQRIAADKMAIRLASFANTVGGTLIVGVGEVEDGGITYADGIHDISDADKFREQVLNHCDTRLKPVPISESFPLVVDGKAVVVFQVEPSVRIVAYQDGDRLKYPYRDSHGTKYMDAARVEMHIMDENRSKYLRFIKNYEAANGPVRVLFGRQMTGANYDSAKQNFRTPPDLPTPTEVHSVHDDYFVVGIGSRVPRENPLRTHAVSVPYECVEMLCPSPRWGSRRVRDGARTPGYRQGRSVLACTSRKPSSRQGVMLKRARPPVRGTDKETAVRLEAAQREPGRDYGA